jgi:7-cyano-7-deazaguanine synthase
LEKTIAQGMDYKIRIHAPLISKTKAEAVHMAKRVGALPALAFSHTCYMGQNPPCGKCMACRLRKRAFKQAGIADPLLVRPKA